MKYIWIAMLVIAFLIWGVYSVKDFLYCRKHFVHPFQHIEDYTRIFIITIVFSIFVVSFYLWLISKIE